MEEVDPTLNRRIIIISSLRYLVHTQSNLAFVVGHMSRFMEHPTVEYKQAIKRILRYSMAGTLDYGPHYARDPGAAHFVGYCDSDLTSDINTTKSMSETMFFLGKCLAS